MCARAPAARESGPRARLFALQASVELTSGACYRSRVACLPRRAAGEPPRTRLDDGREPLDLDPYQLHADADELQPEPSDSSEDDALSADDGGSDEDEDEAQPRPLLLLKQSGRQQQKKKKADHINIAPRTIAVLGQFKPEEILNANSTFASAESCALVLKEHSVRLQTPGRLVMSIRRRQGGGDCISLTCSCTGGTSTKCKFYLHAKPRKDSKVNGQPQPDATWFVCKLSDDGHTCLQERPEATEGENDAQPKQVRARSKPKERTDCLCAAFTLALLTCTRAGACACWWFVACAAKDTAESDFC